VVCHENSGGFEHFFGTQLVPHVSVGVGLAGVHSGTGGIGMGAAEGVGGASNPPATSVGAPSAPNALDAIMGRAHVTDDNFSVDTYISHIEGNVRKFAKKPCVVPDPNILKAQTRHVVPAVCVQPGDSSQPWSLKGNTSIGCDESEKRKREPAKCTVCGNAEFKNLHAGPTISKHLDNCEGDGKCTDPRTFCNRSFCRVPEKYYVIRAGSKRKHRRVVVEGLNECGKRRE